MSIQWDALSGYLEAVLFLIEGEMSRRAFVIVADWPYRQLSDAGKITWCCTGGTEGHLGIFIPCCTTEEVAAHSEELVSHPSAREASHVAFDYMMDKYPRFQSFENDRYYTKEAKVWLYPILDVDAADVHAACLEMAYMRPFNHFLYRCNGVLGCWPWPCWCSNTDRVAPSTCVALTLRIIARARTGSMAPYTSDAAAYEALNFNRCGPSNPCEPAALTGYSPRSALEALQRGRNLGRPVDGFANAIAMCRGPGPTAPLGSTLPLLSLMSRA